MMLNKVRLALAATMLALAAVSAVDSASAQTITITAGQAKVVVPDIQTANATVYLIDAVMVPQP
jgi:uncharacterized surface protein with fasciclin (FAS1) repeats